MKLLILSDSHREMKYMRQAIEQETPDAVFHLGDHDRDAAHLAEEFPSLTIYSVSGNCDKLFPCGAESVLETLQGVRIYAAHGHAHHVKYGYMSFTMAAMEKNARLALFGHTHIPYCEEYQGLYLLNPGACSGYRPSYGVAYVHEGSVSCEIRYL